MNNWSLKFATGLALVLVCASGLSAEPVLVRAEAENWSAQGGGTVQVLDRAEASGGKTVSYWEEPGPWLELSLDLPQPGEYLLSVGYALDWPDARRKVLLDGREIGQITLPGTGGWGNFSSATTALKLPTLAAGAHTLRFINADSRGLSLDWVALHAPEVFLRDRKLSEAEAARLIEPYRPAPPANCLQTGDVRVEFGADGQVRYAQVGGVALATEPPAAAASAVQLATVGKLRVAAIRRAGRLDIWITDGRNLYVIRRADSQAPLRLPAPLIDADQNRLVIGRAANSEELNFATPWPAPRQEPHLLMGGLHLTTAPAMELSAWRSPHSAPTCDLPLRQYASGWVGAARFSRRWGADDPAISVTATGDKTVVRETGVRYPTLAAFYGESMFDLVLTADSATLKDTASGATVTLP